MIGEDRDKMIELMDRRVEMEKSLREEAEYLSYLADAFLATGNRDMHMNLKRSASVIANAAKESSRIASEELDERIDAQNKSVAATLEACLHSTISSIEGGSDE